MRARTHEGSPHVRAEGLILDLSLFVCGLETLGVPFPLGARGVPSVGLWQTWMGAIVRRRWKLVAVEAQRGSFFANTATMSGALTELSLRRAFERIAGYPLPVVGVTRVPLEGESRRSVKVEWLEAEMRPGQVVGPSVPWSRDALVRKRALEEMWFGGPAECSEEGLVAHDLVAPGVTRTWALAALSEFSGRRRFSVLDGVQGFA